MEVVLHAQFHPLDEGYVSLPHGGSEPVTEIEDQAESTMMTDCPHGYFVRTLEDSSLEFDNRSDFAFSDPGADLGGTNKCEYDTSGAIGEPHWTRLFQYLLTHFAHVRWLSTVFPSSSSPLRPGLSLWQASPFLPTPHLIYHVILPPYSFRPLYPILPQARPVIVAGPACSPFSSPLPFMSA